MAGVGDYDPERQNENPRVDDNLDNDDREETTTSLPPENSSRTSTPYYQLTLLRAWKQD